MNRKVFIDCGFYCGSALFNFKSTPEYTDDFIYYGFDPVMNMERMKKIHPNVILDNKALWINDGEIDFYTSNRKGGKANGVYHNKRAGKENDLKVKCIDLSKWLLANFDKDDYIILKLDVEGAEYELLPKMIKDGSINLIDIMYLEWHGGRVNDIKNTKTLEIVKQLQSIDGLITRKSIERHIRFLNRQKNKKESI
jgi:FkbM family methyltransferase